MRCLFVAILAAGILNSPALADRLFTMQINTGGDPAVGVTVCIGTQEAPAAYGGAVTDEEGQVVLLYPDRDMNLEPISQVFIRVMPEDGVGALARMAARSQEGPDLELTGVRVGVPVSCGRRLAVDASELMTDEALAYLEEQHVQPNGLRIVPRRMEARVYARIIERAIADEREAMERAQESDTIDIVRRREQCFGAVGNGCGWAGWDPAFAFCAPDVLRPTHVVCSVNSGSWLHDECCYANPQGKWCGGGGRETNQCSAELDRGWDRMRFAPYTWTVSVIESRTNDTGRVERDRYCAPDGMILPRQDTQFCCSARYRDATPDELNLLLAANPLELFRDRDLKVCDDDGEVHVIYLED